MVLESDAVCCKHNLLMITCLVRVLSLFSGKFASEQAIPQE
jgi:hypothetical protein